MSEGVSSIGSCMAFCAGPPPALSLAALKGLVYVGSEEVVNIGDVGGENEVISYNTVCNGRKNKRMGATDSGQQALELAFNPREGAQQIVTDAYKTKQPVSVREELATGDVLFYVAYVSSNKTLVGGSGDYIRKSVNLEIDSEVFEDFI